MDIISINCDSQYFNYNNNNNEYTYKLQNEIKNVTSMRLSSIELPNSFYTFSKKRGNTIFNIEINSEKYEILIIDGNYDSYLLISNIQKLFDEINSNHGYDFKINLNAINGKSSITNNNNFKLNFINTNKYDKGLGSILGYDKLEYNDKNEYISEYILNTYIDQYILMSINHEKIIETYTHDNYNYSFAKIILNSDKYTIINDNGSNLLTKKKIYKNLINISHIIIKLYDSQLECIEMNNITFSFTLEFTKKY
jgi:hypothetical protein